MSTQLINCITSNDIVDKYKSAYLPHFSTETALTLIINGIFISLVDKAPCYLMLLDLSSIFETLDHNILSIRLNEIGIYGQVNIWFMYFVSSRTSSVKINSSLSPLYFNIYGVPQGSVLSPILFIIYIFPIKSIFHKYPNITIIFMPMIYRYIRNFLVLVILI